MGDVYNFLLKKTKAAWSPDLLTTDDAQISCIVIGGWHSCPNVRLSFLFVFEQKLIPCSSPSSTTEKLSNRCTFRSSTICKFSATTGPATSTGSSTAATCSTAAAATAIEYKWFHFDQASYPTTVSFSKWCIDCFCCGSRLHFAFDDENSCTRGANSSFHGSFYTQRCYESGRCGQR